MKSIKTVFIADDDRNLVEAISTRCESLGFKIRTAHDGLEVAVAVISDPPDLLILDVNMPGADGLSVCEKIMEYQSFEPVPIILLTGRGDDAPVAAAEKLGAHYVRKDSQTWDKLQPLIFELLNEPMETAAPTGARSMSRKMRQSANVVDMKQTSP